jgi:hypothetical protein
MDTTRHSFGHMPPAVGRRLGSAKAWSLWLAACGMFASCQITDHSEKDPNAVSANDLNIPASGFEEGDAEDLPGFAFDSTAINFGRIPQGTAVDRVYHFVNSGKSNLVITDVRGSCSCTVGKEWPRQPIPPGEGGDITVRFDSEGKNGTIAKTVTIVANTQPPTTVLMLKGEVVAPQAE